MARSVNSFIWLSFFFIALGILNLNNQTQSTNFNLKQARFGETKDPLSKEKKGLVNSKQLTTTCYQRLFNWGCHTKLTRYMPLEGLVMQYYLQMFSIILYETMCCLFDFFICFSTPRKLKCKSNYPVSNFLPK